MIDVGMEFPITALCGLMTPTDSFVTVRWELSSQLKALPLGKAFLFARFQMLKWVLIAAGGAIGSIMRYAVQGWVQRFAGSTFPLGTLAVNVSACLAIGFLSGLFAGPQLIREEYRIGLTVGVLGGYSTFSTFGLESFSLANGGEFRLTMVNMLLSCGIGFAAVWFGYRVAEKWFGV